MTACWRLDCVTPLAVTERRDVTWRDVPRRNNTVEPFAYLRCAVDRRVFFPADIRHKDAPWCRWFAGATRAAGLAFRIGACDRSHPVDLRCGPKKVRFLFSRPAGLASWALRVKRPLWAIVSSNVNRPCRKIQVVDGDKFCRAINVHSEYKVEPECMPTARQSVGGWPLLWKWRYRTVWRQNSKLTVAANGAVIVWSAVVRWASVSSEMLCTHASSVSRFPSDLQSNGWHSVFGCVEHIIRSFT
jgi:hypothetical protein